MAAPSPVSGLLRRALIWVAVGCAVALVSRELRKGQPDAAPSGSAAPAATAPANAEVLADLVPELAAALGRRDTRFVLEHVSTSFKEEGGLDYYDVRALVEMAAFSEKPVSARVEALELTPFGDGREIATARVSFARGERLVAGAPLPGGAVTYAIEAVFAREAERWVALTGSYRREPASGATAPSTPPATTR